MTIYYQGFGGGETRDALIDGIAAGTDRDIIDDGLTVISTPVKNGTGALQAAADAAVKGIVGANVGSTKIWCVQGWFNFDGNPDDIVPLLGFSTAYSVDANATTRTLRISGVGIPRVALTPWSEAAVGSGAWTHLAVFADPLTLGTSHTLLRLFVDSVETFIIDVGTWSITLDGGATSTGWVGPGGTTVHSSVALRMDDVCGLFSSSASDAPHLTQWPIGRVYAQHPVSDTGAQLDWTRYPASGTWYDKWNDATGNDGDTEYLWSAFGSAHQDSAMETIATLGWDAAATVIEGHGLSDFSVVSGPVESIIHRSVADGTKWNGQTMCNLANTQTVLDPGTSYVGNLYRLVRTGATWTRAAAGLIFPGLQTTADATDKEWRVTTMMLQWLICNNEYLPLACPPMIPQGAII